MILRMKSKLTAIIIAAIAVAALAGAGAVMASQGSGPSAGTSLQPGQDYDAQGVIKQVTFDQGTTKSGSLDFLPKGQQTTLKVVFTTTTTMSGGSDGADENTSSSNQGTL